MEIGWWNRDEDGKKYQVHLTVFGGKLIFRYQPKRFEPWRDYPSPTDEDWETALQQAERCLVRRLTTDKVVEKIRRRDLT